LLRGVEEDGLLFLPHREFTRGADSLALRLSALHRTLVPSAGWPNVRKSKTALIVPDGALHMIPFEVLVTSAGRGAKRRYWLDDGPALAYGASATSLLETSRRGASTASGGAPVLSVTDVDFTGSRAVGPRSGAGSPARGSWRALPGTARETDAIQKAFGNGVTVLRGEDARETSVRGALGNRRYLHLATHGYVQEGRSHLLAGLVLARPDSITSAEDDGLLELHEIYRLRLDCQLAVLSACESHRGRRVAGEGAFALSRGFLAAGARSVVASQWAVADEPTAVVVGGMFAQFAAGRSGDAPVPVEIALRDGKRRIKNDPRWADPFYWAPLVLTGR
jgi:CHAT domain-containing protein